MDEQRLQEVERVVEFAARFGVAGLPRAEPAHAGSAHRVEAGDGAWWECTRWLAGEPATLETATVALPALAELHRLWRATGDCIGVAPALVARREALLADPGVLAGAPTSDPAVGLALAKLRSAAEPLRPVALDAIIGALEHRLPLQQVHGDLRPEHVLVSPRADGLPWSVTGWIDFSATRVDTPLVDVARFAGELAAGNGTLRDELVRSATLGVDHDVACRVVAALDVAGAVVAARRWDRWLVEGSVAPGKRDAALARVKSLTDKLRTLAS
jgi:hypothetical protein